MQHDDLARDTQAKRMQIAKMRMGLTLRSEKNSAQYRAERKELARMLTVLNEKQKEKTALKAPTKPSRVPSPRASRAKGGHSSRS